jgi:hypothetical protein
LLLNLLLASLGWVVLTTIRSMVIADLYFQHFSLGYFVLTWVGIYLVELTILAMIMLFSGLVRGGFTVLLVTLSYYFICNGLPVVRQSITQRPGEGDGAGALLRWATALFPDFSRVDYKLYVVSGTELPAISLLLSQYGVLMLYSALALWVACVIYRKRDLK